MDGSIDPIDSTTQQVSSAPAQWEDRTARLEGGKGLQDVIYRVRFCVWYACMCVQRVCR